LYQSLLRDSRLIEFLLKADMELAAETRRAGCSCGGALHAGHYERKPRGGPSGTSAEASLRFSFCCGRDGCRRRTRPPSLRFLERKVFYATVVLLVPVLRDGPTPLRMERLCQQLEVSRRTVRRWCRFWREVFASGRVWAAARARFAVAAATSALPLCMLEAFRGSGPSERVIGVLRLVSGQAC
jgi:hypothetical protein